MLTQTYNLYQLFYQVNSVQIILEYFSFLLHNSDLIVHLNLLEFFLKLFLERRRTYCKNEIRYCFDLKLLISLYILQIFDVKIPRC